MYSTFTRGVIRRFQLYGVPLQSQYKKGLVEALKFIDGALTSSFVLKSHNNQNVQLPKERAYPMEKIPINIKIIDIQKITRCLPEYY